MGPSPAGLALSLHNRDTGTDAPKEDVAPGAGREETPCGDLRPRCLVRQPRTFTHHTQLPRTVAEAHAVIRQVGEAKLIAGERALCPTLCV